ncbi:MAG: Fic family protein [Lamprocystis purpurea]|jgi:Fic family protein|uniref:Fic family protein n=1 Tax=Lamprocystis purpurea TaxID=61598 RepID=UPI00035DD04F|nr:Fic family protein [Lamprocystis purpurea]MBV5275748.1 Fic family protein [Lamprocystis purpurea]
MYDDPATMEPMLPDCAGDRADLSDLALDLVAESARAVGQLHPLTEGTLRALLRTINSYYSNLIEGHRTHPIDIERAMRADYAGEPVRRALQLESRAYIEIQQAIEGRIASEPGLRVCDPAFLCWIHERFYQQLPPSLREVGDPSDQERETLVPGRLRERPVQVGRHVPPDARSLDRFLTRFADVYAPERHRGQARFIAAAASHHRLAWIHPFLDGNGRVTRLFTDAYLGAGGTVGHGLWSASRGLARNRAEYLDRLAAADAPRRNDYDGRGNLSLAGLADFCRFFLQTCIDQARFMGGMLATDDLHKRIQGYVQLRAAGTLPGRAIKPVAAPVLVTVFLRGSLPRGEAAALTGYGERAGRDVIAGLLEEGLLVSDSPKGAVRIGLPMAAVPYLFPGVFPMDS